MLLKRPDARFAILIIFFILPRRKLSCFNFYTHISFHLTIHFVFHMVGDFISTNLIAFWLFEGIAIDLFKRKLLK